MKLKAVFFDAFGTLFDTDRINELVCEKVVSDISKTEKKIYQADLSKMWSLKWSKLAKNHCDQKKDFWTLREVVQKSLISALLHLGYKPTETTTKKWVSLFLDSFSTRTRPQPGAKEALEELKKIGMKLGVISDADSNMFHSLIEETELYDYFDFFVVSDKIHAWKFSKEPFQIALSLSSVEPGEALMVGNSLEEDVKVARSSGIHTAYFVKNENTSTIETMEICADSKQAHPFLSSETSEIFKDITNSNLKPEWVITDLRDVPKIIKMINGML
jgi:putative hydrolase of the HAD superfamily